MKLFQSISDWFKMFIGNGLVVMNSKLAKLLNVECFVLLGIVFCSSYSNQRAHIARLQYIDSVIELLVVAFIVSIFTKFGFVGWLCYGIFVCVAYNLFYALSAFISWCIQSKAERGPEFYASHYRLDQLLYEGNATLRIPFGHWRFLKKAWSRGRKYMQDRNLMHRLM